MKKFIFVFALCLNTLLVFPQSLPTPTITSPYESTTLCPVGATRYILLVSSASSGNVWSTGATTQTLSAPVPGTYTVMQVVGTASSAPSAPIQLSYYPMATASLMPAGPFCSTDPTVQLQGQPAGGNYVGPGISGSVFTPSAALLGNNNIILYEYAQFFGTVRCEDTAAIRIVVNLCSTGINGYSATGLQFSVYHEQDTYRYTVSSADENNFRLRIIDLTGKEILSRQSAGENKIDFDLENFPSCIYIAELQLGSRLARAKIIR